MAQRRRGGRKKSRSSSRPARQCGFHFSNGKQCGNMVAADKWEAQGQRCSHHIGKGMVSTSDAANPFVTPSILFPDLLEESFPEAYRTPDRSPQAQRHQRAVSLISDVHTDTVALGVYNARAVVEAHNRWSNGSDMTVPSQARQRYHDGAHQYYELLCESEGLRNVTDIHLVKMKGMSVRPRAARASSKITDPNTGEMMDLFRTQEFPDREHEVVCLQVARSDLDHSRPSMFVVDPLVSALAPTTKPNRPVRDDPGLVHTPFGESPWVTTVEDYMQLENNGSLGWAHSARIVSAREEMR